MTRSNPTPHRTSRSAQKPPTADPFPSRAPLDHVPVWPAPRQLLGFRWRDLALLAAIALLGIAALAGCWPW